jgi:hypothetical protein
MAMARSRLPFVIDADFGDDDGRVVVTDESTGDAEFSHFVLQ